MKNLQYASQQQLVEQATRLLMAELGPAEALRFLTLPRQERTESVKRHREWQATLDQKSFFNEVFGEEAGAQPAD